MVTSKGVTQAFNRSIAVNRSGRYAVLFNGVATSGAILPPTLIDRVTGAEYSVPSAPYPYSNRRGRNPADNHVCGRIALETTVEHW
jgi:hypothetical protein